jgi:hypothetical protein
MRRKVLGNEHPNMLGSLFSVAFLLFKKGEFGCALPLFEECLAKRKKDLGDDHPRTKETQNSRDLCAKKLKE